ncbi:MAG: glycosyltransferase [Actinobacteria bacterium]|nr:glycosyltransferase [Actinomycetota bacterium]MBI3687500.1 glycosyltransferase [Actinomycetota bacterium]
MSTDGEPSLTLVVTAHHTRFLTEAMTSVAAQTSRAFDLVCCADSMGGPGVANELRRFLPYLPSRHTRVLAVAGGSAGRVRNAGFAAARTPWIAYLDGDDLLRPDAIDRLVQVIETGDADIVSTGMSRILADGRSLPLAPSLTYRPPRWIYATDPDTVGHPTFFNQLLAIRRDLWAAYPFVEDTNGEDIDFMLHQLLAGRFRKLPEPLYAYRDTAHSFSKQEFPGGDLCTRRYRRGYYADLFAARYRHEVAGNFADDPEPTP